MTRRFAARFAPAMVTLFASIVAYAQQGTPQRYGQALYVHVPQDKDAQFVEFHKTGAGMKFLNRREKTWVRWPNLRT